MGQSIKLILWVEFEPYYKDFCEINQAAFVKFSIKRLYKFNRVKAAVRGLSISSLKTLLRSSCIRFRCRHQGLSLSAQAAHKFSILLAKLEPASDYFRNKN